MRDYHKRALLRNTSMRPDRGFRTYRDVIYMVGAAVLLTLMFLLGNGTLGSAWWIAAVYGVMFGLFVLVHFLERR